MEWTSPLSPNSAAAATARFHHLRFKRIPSRLGLASSSKADGDCAPAQESTLPIIDSLDPLHSSPKRSAPTAPAPASISSRSGGPLLRPLSSKVLHHTHAFRDLRVGSLRERAEAMKVEKKLEKEKRAQEKEERDAKQRKLDREREKLERRRKFAERRAATILASAIANDDDDDAASLTLAPLVMAFPPSNSSSSSSPSSSDSDSTSPTTTSPTDLQDDLDLDWKSLKKEKLKKKKSRDDSIEDKPRSRKKSGLPPPPSAIPPPVPPKDKKDIKPVVNASVATPPRAAPTAIAPPRPPSKPGPPGPRATSPKRDATNLCPSPTSTFTSAYAYDGPPPNRTSPLSSSGSRK